MKNYLIIGGSSGIGKALAEMLAKEKHTVYATYCNNPIQSNEHGIQYSFLDVMSDSIALDHLPETLDGMVYCPGSINLAPFRRITHESFLADFELQVGGAIKVMQDVFPRLKKVDNAAVVLFSTVAVQTGFNFHSQVAASKGAIEGLTRALAAEYAPSIRVNAIAPSITHTPLAEKLLGNDEKKERNAERHPLKKIGSPDDIAAMAAFLLSEKASWMTGQIVHIDGGMSSIK